MCERVVAVVAEQERLFADRKHVPRRFSSAKPSQPAIKKTQSYAKSKQSSNAVGLPQGTLPVYRAIHSRAFRACIRAGIVQVLLCVPAAVVAA